MFSLLQNYFLLCEPKHFAFNFHACLCLFFVHISINNEQVKGMGLTEEYVQIVSESTLNLNMQGGTHPKVYRRTHPNKFTRLYYCYYKPKSGSSPTTLQL